MRPIHFMLPLAGLLLASCQTARQNPAPKTEMDLFAKADTDKDGKLSYSEFTVVAVPRRFERFDLNKDGSVTLAEARQVAPGFGEAKFKEGDLNHDHKVTLEEYREVAARKNLTKAKFKELDSNHDASIDKAEAAAYAAKLDASSAAPPAKP